MKVWSGPSGDASGASRKMKIRINTASAMEPAESENAAKLGPNAVKTEPTTLYNTREDEGKLLIAPPSPSQITSNY